MFSSEICEIFKNIFFTEHLQWLLRTVLGFQHATLLNNRLQQRSFSVNFAKFLRTSFDRTPLDDCFLCLSVSFAKFFRTLLLQSSSRKLVISYISCRTSTSRYSYTVFSSILNKSEKKPFEGIHLVNLVHLVNHQVNL